MSKLHAGLFGGPFSRFGFICCNYVSPGNQHAHFFNDIYFFSLGVRRLSSRLSPLAPQPSMAMPPSRSWAELQHDLLVSIMTRVGAPDLLWGGASRACSSWRAAARDPLAWRRVDLRDWVALTSGRRAARPGHSSSRVSVHAALVGILEVAAKLAEGRIEAVLLPEFADEDHLLFLAER
jgi:hypothetical protein